jgi:hypothetical protein
LSAKTLALFDSGVLLTAVFCGRIRACDGLQDCWRLGNRESYHFCRSSGVSTFHVVRNRKRRSRLRSVVSGTGPHRLAGVAQITMCSRESVVILVRAGAISLSEARSFSLPRGKQPEYPWTGVQAAPTPGDSRGDLLPEKAERILCSLVTQ